jgi:coenzyme PQQ biosynthesis protein PqqD
VELNETASTILKLCDGRTVAEILSALNEQFPDADLEDDVHAFLEDANDHGWIKIKTNA